MRVRIVGWMLTITALLAVVIAGLTQVWWWILLAFIILTTIPHDPLSIKMARDGRFWIKGCSDAFLRSCEAGFGAAQDRDVGSDDDPFSSTLTR